MESANLKFRYDRDSDILYVDTCKPYAKQESEEIGDDVVARINPVTGRVENLEVMFYSTRLLRSNELQFPIHAILGFGSGMGGV